MELQDWHAERLDSVKSRVSNKQRTRVRRSGLADMYAKKTISIADMIAADRFRALWVTTDGLKGIDYSRPRVDGGRRGGAIPGSLYVQEELQDVRRLLGDKRFSALRVAAVEEGGLADVAKVLGVKSKETASRELRHALETLSEYWALAS